MIQVLNNNYKINKFNTVNLKPVRLIAFTAIPEIQDQITVQKKNHIPLFALLPKISGTFSKEDCQKVNKQIAILSGQYGGEDIPKLFKTAGKNQAEILNLINESGLNIKEKNEIPEYLDEPDKINDSARKKIKNILIKQVAIREFSKQERPYQRLMNFPTIGDWFKGYSKQPKIPLPCINTIFVHPVDKALSLTGAYTNKELLLIGKKSGEFDSLPTKNILTQKENFLNKLNRLTERPDQNAYGTFTQKELNQIKNHSMEYTALNEVLKKRNIYNKAVESVVYNSTKKMSRMNVGENVTGLGLIVKKTKIYDTDKKQKINCLIIFNTDPTGNTLRLIKTDKEFEDKITNLENNYHKITALQKTTDIQEQINSLNETAKFLIKEERNLLVSEASFNIINKETAKFFLEEMPKPIKNNDVLKTINDNDSFIIVRDFINHNPKRYINAGMEVGFTLLHLAFKNKCNAVFIKALAMNNSKNSPVGMYLKYGFEPISHKKENIKEQIINSPDGFDYNEPVWLYLPENSILRGIVAKRNPLKEIFEDRKKKK